MTKDRNIAAQQAFGEAVNSGNLDALDGLVALDAVDHDPAPGQAPGPNGYKSFFGAMRTAFPDLEVKVEHLVADEESVAFAYTLSGTHQGPFQGHEPTGKKVNVRGVQVSRFDELGMLVERWGSTDELTMMNQLGINPS